ENGAWLYDPRHNDFHLDPAISPEHIDMVRSAQQWCMQTFGDRPLAVEPGKTAMFSLYSPDPTVVPEITPAIRDGFAQHGWDLRVSQSVAYLNCDLAHISKATGIDRFVAHTGIPTSRLAGIGDTIGDMAIRERVAFFACPANADQRLKDVADYVSPHEHAAGVVDILTQL
ncbi:MAG: HAD hydrolase family protein, partial [Planctomycetota bacterium]